MGTISICSPSALRGLKTYWKQGSRFAVTSRGELSSPLHREDFPSFPKLFCQSTLSSPISTHLDTNVNDSPTPNIRARASFPHPPCRRRNLPRVSHLVSHNNMSRTTEPRLRLASFLFYDQVSSRWLSTRNSSPARSRYDGRWMAAAWKLTPNGK